MINTYFKRLSIVMLLLTASLTAPAYAWQEVDTMNMCNQPVQVVRAYSGSAKGWSNRDNFTASQKRAYARNCPQVRAPKKVHKKKKAYRKVKVKRTKRKSKTCRDCYKKGYRDGYRAAHKKHKRHYRKKHNKNKKVRRIRRSGYRNHAEEVADCKRVDWANRANRSKVIARW
ncbi:MAG: hypothetical protein KAG34_04365 [Cocleimonas sp.]|nr:hypothetical protein [Cocleimonas sp.]